MSARDKGLRWALVADLWPERSRLGTSFASLLIMMMQMPTGTEVEGRERRLGGGGHSPGK